MSPNIVRLNSNENPLGASPSALAAAAEAMQCVHHYPDERYQSLKQALAQHLTVQPAQLTIGNGSEYILELIVKTFLQRQGTAVTTEYAFLTIPTILSHYHIPTRVVACKNWQYDINDILQHIDHTTRLLFIVNPNNPTSSFLTKTAFSTLMAAIPAHVIVVVDEAYSEYMNTDDYPSALHYLANYSNLIITRTFSKAYGLAALRIGYSISSPALAALLDQHRLPYPVNQLASAAAIAALHDKAHLQKTQAFNHAGLSQLRAGLDRLGLSYIPPTTNFITVHLSPAKSIYQNLLQKGIIVRPLDDYGLPDYIRVSVGTEKDNAAFLTALEKLVHYR